MLRNAERQSLPDSELFTKENHKMKAIKTIIITALVAVIGCFQANAELRFGVKAGLNVDKMHFNEKTFDADNRCGFTAGVMTEFTVPIIGVGFDLSVMYTRMNSQMDAPVDPATGVAQGVDGNLGKNFLEIPLNLKYKISIPAVASLIAPYIYTGPTMALKLDGGDTSSFKTKTVQMGWNVGLGLQLIKHLQIGAGYTFGINNVMKYVPQDYASVGKLKVKNNYWTVTAAWLF